MKTILAFIHAAPLLCRVSLAELKKQTPRDPGRPVLPHLNTYLDRTILQELL